MTTSDSGGETALPPDLPSIDGLRLRAFDPERDYEPLVGLIRAVARLDNLDWLPTVDILRNDFDHAEGFDPRQDVLIAELDGSFVAAAVTSPRDRGGLPSHNFEIWVDPVARRRGIGRMLLGWTEHRAAAVARLDGRPGPRELETWIVESQVGAAALLEEAGYQIGRYGLQMLRDLAEPIEPVELPAELEIRPVEAADHRRIWDADSEAFRDHWNSAQRTEADYEGWFANPDLDTTLWQVAWHESEVAGSVMSFVFAEENRLLGLRRGWLEHISVRRPWRRQGLASALVLRAMVALRAAGLDEAALEVDAENVSGAVRVYERLGFRRTRTTVK